MGQGKAVLHGPGRRKITKSTAVSLVAKHWAMYFLGVIFIDSLKYLYELGAAYRPILQLENGGCRSSRPRKGQGQI